MKITLIASALIVGASGAMAQGFTGATVGLEYFDLSDIDDASSTEFSASVEFEVAPSFSVAAGLASRSFEAADDVDYSNFVLHGIYDISPEVAVGAFVGRETLEDFDIDNYGVEVAYMAGPLSMEGYIGAGEADTTDLQYLGVAAGYGLGNGFSVIGGFDRVSFDIGGGDASYTTLDIGGEYAFVGGTALYAKTGQVQLDQGSIEAEENYFEIGVSVAFGANGGTTFSSSKGLFETVPLFAN